MGVTCRDFRLHHRVPAQSSSIKEEHLMRTKMTARLVALSSVVVALVAVVEAGAKWN